VSSGPRKAHVSEPILTKCQVPGAQVSSALGLGPNSQILALPYA
jgi:hypothetical protein